MSSELKTQFHNYMTLQRFSDHTKRSYVTGVKLLSKYYMQSPDTLTNDQIQDYIRYLLEERKLSWGTCNSYLSGIVCFYRHICKWTIPSFKSRPGPVLKNCRLFLVSRKLNGCLLQLTILNTGCCCKPSIAQGCGSVNWFALNPITSKVMLTV